MCVCVCVCVCVGLGVGVGYGVLCIFAIVYVRLVPDAHYSERQDKPFSLPIQQLKVNLKLNCGFLFFAPWALMG